MSTGPGPVPQAPGPGPGSAPQTHGSPPPGPTSSPFRPPPLPRPTPPPPDPPVASPGAPAGPRPGTPTFKVSPRDERDVDGPPTVAWQPSDREGRPQDRNADEIDPTPGQGTPVVENHDGGDTNPEEQALDDFFEDEDASGYLSERRFGGRLRRRR